MNIVIVRLLVITVIITASALLLEQYVKKDESPRLITSEDFTPEQREIILAAGKEWQDKFGLSRAIFVDLFKGEVVKENNGWTYSTMEVAKPGLILIDPSTISNKDELRNTIIHSLSHADTRTIMLATPLNFSDGQIIGYKGVAIMVRLKSGEVTFWTRLEEGICERNAVKVNSQYTVHNASYFAVGKKALEHFPNADIMPYVRSNNIPALIGIILNKDPLKVTVADIESVMSMYEAEWRKGDKSRQ
jgi:hypothetical protein